MFADGASNEVIVLKWVIKLGPCNRICVIIRRDPEDLVPSLSACNRKATWGQSEKVAIIRLEEDSGPKLALPDLDLEFPASRAVNKFLWFQSPSLGSFVNTGQADKHPVNHQSIKWPQSILPFQSHLLRRHKLC